MLEAPALAHRALDLSTRMIERVVDFFGQRFGPMQVRHDYGYCIAHCPLVMISPALHDEFVPPYENRLAERTEYITERPDAFELHHCTSVIDPYLPAIVDWPLESARHAGCLPAGRWTVAQNHKTLPQSVVDFAAAIPLFFLEDLTRLCSRSMLWMAAGGSAAALS